ncbi:hypothetical protein [Streptomyces sp. NPDC093707]|uniref:hypothetical protein n=1 Tax=Streptomyces sp. NPDC093707 TaxID=3154984 RepID=UPI00344E3AAC
MTYRKHHVFLVFLVFLAYLGFRGVLTPRWQHFCSVCRTVTPPDPAPHGVAVRERDHHRKVAHAGAAGVDDRLIRCGSASHALRDLVVAVVIIAPLALGIWISGHP